MGSCDDRMDTKSKVAALWMLHITTIGKDVMQYMKERPALYSARCVRWHVYISNNKHIA